MCRRISLLIVAMLIGMFSVTACLVLMVPIAARAIQPAANAARAVSVRLPAPAPSIASQSNAPSDVVAAVQAVILKANQEQQQAVAAQDPTAMRDTATSAYYSQASQNLSDLLNSGVTAIKLTNLTWGPITQQNSTTVQATTSETWSTTMSDGSTLQQTDTNVYTLVLENGAWKVRQDDQPNSPAPQSPNNPGAAVPPGVQVAPAPPAAPDASTSRNWAGYAATGGTFTSVSGTWTVPNVSAGTAGMDATWVGIGGVSSRDLIQAGTQAIVQSGQVSYSAWYETLPQAQQTIPMTVNAGDKVSVSITEQGNGTWEIAIQDATNAQTYQTTLTYTSSNSSAEWIEESPATGRGQILPLDSFGTVSFTSATAVENGQPRTLGQAGAQPITMYAGNQQALAQPSAVGANGSSFTITRTNVAAPSVGGGGRRSPRSRNSP